MISDEEEYTEEYEEEDYSTDSEDEPENNIVSF